ncbi:3-methyladenine DNA glycosylase [Thermococcus kodakarensis KOD1]|uniref:3-methyladenine DNA glycosylase n=1 Tax=Thermococcus kodakarensis (strain ATCC BAA-918 / JCM 12380 / KOD1) TaxID=69014 RepID=Q5JG19_THEKO|nr:DNA-3-methyladenine glycosylase [Thermococcus kodakarensis]WCN28419.1 DNA-3-methyladenine glycosylase [Thermococcus kodakarensis]WCN30715.1 DNA-3-methyladenine glycosylase [Thermococcus kodakarensis]BAD84534.1 3-methyladenine DNA glycosylase [Thermococcus kodakarensis KOD1]
MAVDIRKTAHEMVKNGTWKLKGDTFYQALRLKSGVVGIVAYNGDFLFPETWGRKEKKEAREKLSFILGLDTDLDSFYSEISDSPFSFLVEEFKGLTVPAAPSPYQALVEVIAQQQVNFEFAQRTIRNLVEMAGEKAGNIYVFPTAEKIASLSPDELKRAKLGYRAEYIKHVTELYLKGELKLDLWEMDEKEAIKYLTAFRGIGKWTAELFLAYGLRKNTYPAGDLGLRRGIAKIFGKSVKEVKEKDVREILEPYGKWKGLLAFYITCYDRKTELERRRIK